jgi:hypothetical protein
MAIRNHNHEEGECETADCERRIHQRINERITWKMAAAITTLLGTALIAGVSYTTIEVARLDAQWRYNAGQQLLLIEKQDKAIDHLDTKLDNILSLLLSHDRKMTEGVRPSDR